MIFEKEYDDLENLSFWQHLSTQQKNIFTANTMTACYEKGAHLHYGGEDCAGMMLLKKGQVRVYLLSEDGREITLYRLYPGDVCVLSAACVLEEITFDVFVDAETDTELLMVQNMALQTLMQENSFVEAFVYRMAAERFSDVMWAMQQILFMGMDRRLAIFLTEETVKRKSLEIDMTQEQIAKYIGTAREVVSRMVKYFAKEGILETFRGGIRILDIKKLRKIATNN